MPTHPSKIKEEKKAMAEIISNSGTTGSINITSGFVDLSTYDDLEGLMYGGRARNLFRRMIIKTAWFSLVTAQMNSQNGNVDFGSEVQAVFSRTADYVLNCWAKIVLPEVRGTIGDNPLWSDTEPSTGNRQAVYVNNTALTEYNTGGTMGPLKEMRPGKKFINQPRWTRNIGHNIFEYARLHFNDILVAELTPQYLDFWASFTLPPGKSAGYQRMIGNVPALINPYATDTAQDGYSKWEVGANAGIWDKDSRTAATLPSRVLNIPLPFYFTHSTEDSIINAATPYNDISVRLKMRNLNELLVVDQIYQEGRYGASTNADHKVVTIPSSYDSSLIQTDQRLRVELHAHYALIPNGDREKFVAEPRIDQLIEQVWYTRMPWAPKSLSTLSLNLHHPHTVRGLFFGARNTSIRGEHSNYGTDSGRFSSFMGVLNLDLSGTENASDPIGRATLKYEGINRFQATSEYYSTVAPYYFAPNIPVDPGQHLLSYSVNLAEPTRSYGATNYARLSSVILEVEASDRAKAVSVPDTDGAMPEVEITSSNYDVHVVVLAQTIWRSTGGAGGLPYM